MSNQMREKSKAMERDENPLLKELNAILGKKMITIKINMFKLE